MNKILIVLPETDILPELKSHDNEIAGLLAVIVIVIMITRISIRDRKKS